VQAQRSLGALFDVRACKDASPVSPPPAAVANQVKDLGERIERTLVRAAARDVTARDDAAVTEALSNHGSQDGLESGPSSSRLTSTFTHDVEVDP
jgi:hypothetical protein